MAQITQADASGRALIERFEGFSPTWYKCPAGVLTIGFGHSVEIGTPPTYKAGQRITQAQGDLILSEDMRKTEAQLVKLLKRNVSQNQFNALESLLFNIGVGNLEHSHLLEYVNNGNFSAAAPQFLLWDTSGGKVLPGLVQRRKAEQLMFESGVANPSALSAGSHLDMPRKVDAIPGVNTRPSIIQTIESLL